jgi:hypothetical protein
MPMTDGSEDFRRVREKLEGLLKDMGEDIKFAGEQAATAIVQTTLAGIGENDQPFAPYSKSYTETIQAVGGKPGQVVNLRGLFYHEGQKRYAGKRQMGQGRRAYIGVGFLAMSKEGLEGGATAVRFFAQTLETRPQRGITDKLSEMSLDLIKIEVEDTRLRLSYEPRKDPYMIYHQNGEGRLPQRKWFTANKAAVKAALVDSMTVAIQARVNRVMTGGAV